MYVCIISIISMYHKYVSCYHVMYRNVMYHKSKYCDSSILTQLLMKEETELNYAHEQECDTICRRTTRRSPLHVLGKP